MENSCNDDAAAVALVAAVPTPSTSTRSALKTDTGAAAAAVVAVVAAVSSSSTATTEDTQSLELAPSSQQDCAISSMNSDGSLVVVIPVLGVVDTMAAVATVATVATGADPMDDGDGIKSSKSDPQIATSVSAIHETMLGTSKKKSSHSGHHHQRRSNSDIPLSVQTGAAFLPDHQQQQHQQFQHSFDYYNSNNNIPHHNHHQYTQQQQQQPPPPPAFTWPDPLMQQQQQQQIPTNMIPVMNMYYPTSSSLPYNNNNTYSNLPPPPNSSYFPAPPHHPPPSYQHHHQQQQQQHFYPNSIYPSQQQQQHQQQQTMQYHSRMQGGSQPMHYPYPPTATFTTTTQQPPTIQKAVSYTGVVGGSADRITTTTNSNMPPPPPPPPDERQPLLLSSSLDRRTTTARSLLNPAQQQQEQQPQQQPQHQQQYMNASKNSKHNHPTAANMHHPPRAQQYHQPQSIGGGGKRHRRSLSSPATESGMYGAFWDAIVSDANGDPLSVSQGHYPTTMSYSNSKKNTIQPQAANMQQKFSPIAEFRKLQLGLSPRSSPNQNNNSNTGTTTGRKRPTLIGNHPKAASFRDRISSTNNNSNQIAVAASFSPTHHITTTNPRFNNDFNYIPSTLDQQQQHHSRRIHNHYISYGGDGDNTITTTTTTMPSRPLLLQKGESLRKMHVRQQTAQLLVEDIKGIEQPLTCRNVIFLLLFVLHLVVMMYLGHQYGPNAFVYHGTDTDAVTIVYSSLIYIAVWSGLFAIGVSALLLGVMTYFASHFVQIALFFMIILSFIWGTIGIGLSPKTIVPVTGIIALALAVAYTFIVWDRIPFASANLVTALTALRDFRAIVYVAFGFQFVALIYSVAYSILVFGIYDAMQDYGPLNLSDQMTYVVYFLLIFSFSWTLQVIQSTVHAITAAVIYKWWHEGRTEQNSSLVKSSCLKTIFYSMGSICFGSLVVGPVRSLRWFFVLFRPSSTESSSLMCLHECVHYIQSCVSYCVDSLSAKCNAWAYTYIGMYHYGFLEAGGNATVLFEKRGWSTIVSDDLVPNVLFLTSLVIGGITGCFAYLLSELDRLAVVIPRDDPGLAPFVEGVIIGLVLPSVVFSLISSSVNAVLVCFASSPMDFERQHPTLSHDMRAAWRDVWPRALLVDDAVAIRLVEQNSPFLQSTFQGRAPSPF